MLQNAKKKLVWLARMQIFIIEISGIYHCEV